MNKKEHVTVSEREFRKTLDELASSRESIADALGITSTTLRKWIKDGRVPQPQWKRLNSEEFKKTLAIQKKFGANHYVVPEKKVDDKTIAFSKAPPSDEDNESDPIESHQIDLSLLSLDQLVDEIEYRGWKVQISRKTEEK